MGARHLYRITFCPASSGPSRLALKPFHEIEREEIDRAERAYYFGWDEEEARIEARFQALDDLQLTYD